jgi:hypothetical protein
LQTQEKWWEATQPLPCRCPSASSSSLLSSSTYELVT